MTDPKTQMSRDPLSDPLSNWRAALLVAVIWFAGLGAAAQYGKISVTFDRLGALYPEAGTQLGLALSLVGSVGIVLGVIAGVLGARIGLRRCLIWGLGLGGVLSLGQAALLAGGAALEWLLIARVFEGLSHLAIVVAAPTLIARIAPPRWHGFVMTLWGTFFGVAFTLLAWFGLPLVDHAGLAVLFVLHGLWMVGFALLLSLVTLPPSPHPVPELRLSGLLAHHLAIYRSPFVNAAAVGWLFYTFCFVSLLTLLPPTISAEWRALTLGAMPLMSIVSAMTLGVYLLRYTSAVGVAVIGFVLTALVVLALILWPGAPLLCLAMAFALGLVQGAGFTIVPQLNTAEGDRAAANGAMAQTGNLGNTLGTPVMLMIGAWAGYAGMMMLALLVLLAGALAHLGLARLRARA